MAQAVPHVITAAVAGIIGIGIGALAFRGANDPDVPREGNVAAGIDSELRREAHAEPELQVESTRATARALPLADGGVPVPTIPDGGSAASVRQQRAQALTDSLALRIRARVASPMSEGLTAENLADEQNYYLEGFVEAALTLAPEHLPELRSSVENALCAGESDAAAIVYSRLVARVPDLATTRGLDCVISARQEEDVVLANALDAYRGAQLPPSPAWLAWQERATSPAIRRRFLSDEEIRQRIESR